MVIVGTCSSTAAATAALQSVTTASVSHKLCTVILKSGLYGMYVAQVLKIWDVLQRK